MRILVTGSRDWDDRSAVLNALGDFDPDDGPYILVHGGARGLDLMAAKIAASLGWSVACYPADWDTHGRAAGVIRNQQMVDWGADICLAFPKGESHGTRDCIRRAEKAGIPVRIYEG